MAAAGRRYADEAYSDAELAAQDEADRDIMAAIGKPKGRVAIQRQVQVTSPKSAFVTPRRVRERTTGIFEPEPRQTDTLPSEPAATSSGGLAGAPRRVWPVLCP